MKYFKLQYITLLILLILGVSLVPSCNKDKTDCPTCPTGGSGLDCEDIQNVKKFFAFKVGSWWVYEEETSGDRDSVYVTQYQNDPSNYNFDVRVYSTYQDYYYHYWPEFSSGSNQCNENGITCSTCIRVKRSKYKSGDFVGEGRCFIFVPKTGDFEYVPNTEYSNNRIIVENITSTFDNNQLFFERTIEIHELNTYVENIQPTNHYFSENVGLVRKELLDSSQVWNLINYHIEE